MPWLSEISGAVHLALLGLMAGRQDPGEFQLTVHQNIRLFFI